VVPFVAQASVVDVCGPREEAERLCVLVYDVTGSEPLARAVDVGATAVWILLVVVLAVVATQVSKFLVLRYSSRLEQRLARRMNEAHQRGELSDTRRFRTRRLQRLQAASGVVRGVFGVIIWSTALLLVLDLLGVPLQPLLAGAGLAGIVLGFGAQQLVRDVLAGIAMLIEDQYGVGDWIEVDGRIGVVERVGLRSTAFRDVDGVLHHVLNGYIQHVGNLSQEWARATLDVPIALDADVATAKAVIQKVATELADDPLWGQDVIGPPEIWGVQHHGPDGVQIRVVIPTKPLRNWDLTRQLRERLKYAFDSAGIRMPGQLVDLGGQQSGFPVLHHLGEQEHLLARRHRGLVPPDVTPLDVPPTARPGSGDPADADSGVGHDDPSLLGSPTGPVRVTRPPAPDADTGSRPPVDPADDDADAPADATTVLRLEQGPRARPD
jgi:moderate conductance mechanosensitive channel